MRGQFVCVHVLIFRTYFDGARFAHFSQQQQQQQQSPISEHMFNGSALLFAQYPDHFSVDSTALI